MPIDYITISLVGDDDDTVNVSGKNQSGVHDESDTQIVTVLDGGESDDDDDDDANYLFDFWGNNDADNDEFHFDLSGFDDNFSIAVKSMDPDDTFYFTNVDDYTVSGTVWTINYTGSDGNPYTVTIDAASANSSGVATVVVCFAKGTQIRVPDGEVPIEALRAGDQVICGDGEIRPIRWIGGRLIGSSELKNNRKLRPICFQSGALGKGTPDRPLRLSPQHRILLQDWRAELLFGENQVLASATSLQNDRSITRDRQCEEVAYFHILLDGHHTIFANAVECESLMPAELALTALDSAAREEILTIFPDMAADLDRFGPVCAQVLKSHEVQVLRQM